MSEIESESNSILINGNSVWYEKFGCGDRVILMIPGAIGTGRTDYLPQLEDEDALDMNKFTIIAVEGIGWGRSCPPTRKYGAHVYDNDAECFYQIMQQLGYKRFSIIAWSDGTKSAFTLTVKYPEAVQGIVCFGVEVCSRDRTRDWLHNVIEIETWGKAKLDCYRRAYDSDEYIQELWRKFVKSTEYLKAYFGDEMFKDKYHLVKCPVLIVLGDRDMVSDIDQCLLLCEQIKNCRLERFPTAGHDFHLRCPSIAKRLIEEHLLSCK